jgi:hypothetical protein
MRARSSGLEHPKGKKEKKIQNSRLSDVSLLIQRQSMIAIPGTMPIFLGLPHRLRHGPVQEDDRDTLLAHLLKCGRADLPTSRRPRTVTTELIAIDRN